MICVPILNSGALSDSPLCDVERLERIWGIRDRKSRYSIRRLANHTAVYNDQQ
jgi:hypothetical protein